jgi:hypothetical protein
MSDEGGGEGLWSCGFGLSLSGVGSDILSD